MDETGRTLTTVERDGYVVIDNVPNGTHTLTLETAQGSGSLTVTIAYPNGYQLRDTTAQDYWRMLGGYGSVDVSIYDRNNDGGFTDSEEKMLRFLRRMQEAGFTPAEIQAFINYYDFTDDETGRAGGGRWLTYWLNKNLDSYLAMRDYAPDIVKFTPETIGFICFSCIAEGYGVPTGDVIREGFGHPPLPFPIHERASAVGMMDWYQPVPMQDGNGFLSAWEKFYGLTGLGGGEDTYNTSSADLTFFRTYTEMTQGLPRISYYIGAGDVMVKIVGIAHDERNYPGEVTPHTDLQLNWRLRLTPADTDLYTPYSAYRGDGQGEHPRFLYGWNQHIVIDDPDHPDHARERFEAQVGHIGDYVNGNTKLGIVNPYGVGYIIADLGFYVRASDLHDAQSPFGSMFFSLPGAGGRMVEYYLLDPFSAWAGEPKKRLYFAETPAKIMCNWAPQPSLDGWKMLPAACRY